MADFVIKPKREGKKSLRGYIGSCTNYVAFVNHPKLTNYFLRRTYVQRRIYDSFVKRCPEFESQVSDAG